MTDEATQPRRRRRSSISERIQRALHMDRADKKRQSFSPGDDQQGIQHSQSAQQGGHTPVEDSTRIRQTEAVFDHDVPASFSLQDDTLPNTLTPSSQNSRLPSVGTPGSSPSVQPGHLQDDRAAPRHVVISDRGISQGKDEICASPTWKTTTRKERRATKRLEAERKELEKRLLKLEESQARLEHGIYERQSRRLTKKQPLDDAKRSSSANSERPRSSRSLSAFFAGSRRSSRSRASSADGSDRRRSSDRENAGGGPPTLPLSLPERFGTAVSRELASRHGTTLMTNHQLQRSSHILHHVAGKSDDLRENWRMAEAWQKQNSEREASDSLVSSKMEKGVNPGPGAGIHSGPGSVQKQDDPLVYPSFANPPLDLDRELFTASLRQEPKLSDPQKPGPSILRQTGRSISQGQYSSQSVDTSTTRVTTARQLQSITHGDAKSPSHSRLPSSGPKFKDVRNGMSTTKKEGADLARQKEYKSSPLSMNPVTGNEVDRIQENQNPPRASASEKSTRELVPQPLRINLDIAHGRNGQVSQQSLSEKTQSRAKQSTRQGHRAPLMSPVEISHGNLKHNNRKWNPKPIAFEKAPRTASEFRPPSAVIPPLKHPGRKYALAENSPYGRLSLDGQQIPTLITTDDLPMTRSQETMPQIRHALAEMPASKSTPNVITGPRHSRSSSGASSYDTADEEVLDTPNHPTGRKGHSSVLGHDGVKKPGTYTPDAPEDSDSQSSHNSGVNPLPPPLAQNGVLSQTHRNHLPKPQALKKDQLIAKLFVICCQCQYWHDLPSELYAKIACSEHIAPDSRLVRTFSRRTSLSRRASLKKAILGGISTDAAARRLTMGRQKHEPFANGMKMMAGADSGGGQDESGSTRTTVTQSVPLSCCWCGHEMNRACCQGWTTLVQMRERHH